MATASTAQAAPPKQATLQPIRRKEPEFYLFRLTDKHPEYYPGSSPYAARIQIKTMDDILWAYRGDQPLKLDDKFEKGDENLDFEDPKRIEFHPRRIRYISGLNTIFVDEQEREGRPLEARLLNNTNNYDRLMFEKGNNKVPSTDRVRRAYLHCMSECKNQHPNARRMNPVKEVYELIDHSAAASRQVMLDDMLDKAFELASKAEKEIMYPHAKYLGIPFNYDMSQEEKDEKVIRAEYKRAAMADPYKFMDTFNKPDVKLIYWITSLIDKSELTINGISSGQAHWIKSGNLIANLPPDQEPIPFLAKYALSSEGEEFGTQLKAYNTVK